MLSDGSFVWRLHRPAVSYRSSCVLPIYPPPPKADFSNLSRLLAEDGADAVLLFNRLFRKCGASARHVPNGAVAIEYLASRLHPGENQFLPQAIFLDIILPVRSGFEVLAWMRGQTAFDRTAVVMVSTSSRAGEIEKARQLGANAYFEKFPTSDEIGRLLSAIKAQGEPIGRGLLSTSGLLSTKA